jgi:hypothetical protein
MVIIVVLTFVMCALFFIAAGPEIERSTADGRPRASGGLYWWRNISRWSARLLFDPLFLVAAFSTWWLFG